LATGILYAVAGLSALGIAALRPADDGRWGTGCRFEDEASIRWVTPDGTDARCVALDDITIEGEAR
jgi:hypothetical protein